MKDPKKDVYLKELELLRGELKDLKECQVKYFTLSITSTGVILGIISRFGSDMSSLFYLMPLAILIPCWVVFFDKAKTITRAVAYYGLLESLIIGKKDDLITYIGYENALTKFRNYTMKNKSKTESNPNMSDYDNKFKYFKEVLSAPIGSYWRIMYFSFGILSLLCILIPFWKEILSHNIRNISILVIIFIMLIIIARKVFLTYIKLVDGSHSYNANKETWEKILIKKNNTKKDNNPLTTSNNPLNSESRNL